MPAASRPLLAVLCFAFALLLPQTVRSAPAPYDPLSIPADSHANYVDLTFRDASRVREIPLRVYLPVTQQPAPVVLFSHGLGGSRENNPYLGEHWSARGYVVVFMQHQGSDEKVWKNVPIARRMQSLKDAANIQNAVQRFRDVPAVIDQLERWNTATDSPLAGRLDLRRIGMAGHSFGAVTTQAVSGQRFMGARAMFSDERILAALAMSPSVPRGGKDATEAFGAVSLPWLLMTGTRDVAPIGDQDVAARLAVYPALPSGSKYELVLDGAEHSAFGDRSLPGDREARNPNHHRVILALSTAFWDSYLRGDAAARSWLDGTGPTAVLAAQDRWQHK